MIERKIRVAEAKDTDQLMQLMYQYMDFYERPRPEENALRHFIGRLQQEPCSGLQFVAEQGGSLVGFATLYFTFSTLQLKRAAIMNDLFVAPSERGLKVGEGLFQACLQHVRSNGYAYMTWETAQHNTAAQTFYDKMGGLRSDWLVYEIS
ncbi:GNAT family N-acetyltransferase [Paenibacillus sp. UNC451MF]|uniref:GNAT family N-acetyltransferase n=1 Tax=Paenibacillus sp. UNC451MF TaxID=1449063 RepID=UPI00048C7400|nr:GNAT family N-acetyltransferase [Paenibacillus sp. UNC451MF]